MIPKRIVQTWRDATVDDMIPSLKAAVATWKTLNPDYEMVYYNNDIARQFIVDNYDADVLEAYDTLVPGAYKADLFRYCELYKNGGFYADIKLSCLIPLDRILENTIECNQLLTLDRDGCGLLNAFFGSIPGNPLLLNCINVSVSNVKSRYYGMDALDPTGPRLMGKQFRLLNNLPMDTGDCSQLYLRNNIPNTKLLLAYGKEIQIYVPGVPLIPENSAIDTRLEAYRAINNTHNYYPTLWGKRSIYTDSPPHVPVQPKGPKHMYLPRNLRR
jgi:hypothetical protein